MNSWKKRKMRVKNHLNREKLLTTYSPWANNWEMMMKKCAYLWIKFIPRTNHRRILFKKKINLLLLYLKNTKNKVISIFSPKLLQKWALVYSLTWNSIFILKTDNLLKMVKIYVDLMSQPARALFMFVRATNVKHEVQQIALRNMEHKTPEYTKLQPFQTVV